MMNVDDGEAPPSPDRRIGRRARDGGGGGGTEASLGPTEGGGGTLSASSWDVSERGEGDVDDTVSSSNQGSGIDPAALLIGADDVGKGRSHLVSSLIPKPQILYLFGIPRSKHDALPMPGPLPPPAAPSDPRTDPPGRPRTAEIGAQTEGENAQGRWRRGGGGGRGMAGRGGGGGGDSGGGDASSGDSGRRGAGGNGAMGASDAGLWDWWWHRGATIISNHRSRRRPARGGQG